MAAIRRRFVQSDARSQEALRVRGHGPLPLPPRHASAIDAAANSSYCAGRSSAPGTHEGAENTARENASPSGSPCAFSAA